ncbi:arrestin C-terminal domain-containing protein NDAI_0G05980 [Naumovozyma dairenensis CBS 421]|uniref:Arrestin C-terminal-like domain-containing protein n=1 Tax=Naumovozyma dairenensis (strain ATCC 10597 / BCRC 20456 / CBS 421 / NBRC 0211 / NRRL Y-12639) TaxID=1071378 RepID=J7S4Q3_NAUDC|nr:hypothetical protein NDAI_0G05980 [Naumovozyma dairenensis CBS 421]CCK73581.1 hypothetical protein NDAI_0G05980 [Naumovozyma dairenensis CBS 421]
MLSSASKFSKDPSLFDIRIKNAVNDVLIIKGTPAEAPSILLSGSIVISVLEPLHIKNLKLKLYGRLRLNIPLSSAKGTPVKYNGWEKRFYQYSWDQFDIHEYCTTTLNGRRSIASRSSGNIAGMRKRAQSSASLSSLSSSTSITSNSSRTLMTGNYEIPFSAILPGSTTESVEGLDNASVTYKLEAVIERPRSADLICKKHLRIVRTMSPDSLEISETISVDNSWPGKVDYSISIPTKAIAIGSSTPINIMLIPLLKGLKLGSVKIYLVENSQYCGAYGGVIPQERVVSKLKLKDPLMHESYMKQHGVSDEKQDDNDTAYQDRWDISTTLQVPTSLTKCTQDCNILSNIKVRHKLRCVLSLTNPDGHVSELRASLPIKLFISPFVSLKVKSPETLDKEIGPFIARSPYSSLNNSSSPDLNNPADEEEDVIFSRVSSEVNVSAPNNDVRTNINGRSTTSTPMSAFDAANGLMAPPNYGNHIFDKLWGEVPNTDNPSTCGTVTPMESGRLNTQVPLNQNNNDMSNNNPQNQQLLGEYNMPSINILQPQPQLLSSSRSPSSFSSPRFATPEAFIIRSPTLTPGFSQQSRTSSFSRQASSSSLANDWELVSLSRVPSYHKAMKSDIPEDDLPPTYPPSKTKNSGKSIKRPANTHYRSNSSLLAVPETSNRPRSLSNRSLNGSSNSLRALSKANTDIYRHTRQISNSSLSSIKNRTVSQQFSLNMTPVSNRNSSSTSIQQMQRNSSSTRNLSASQRSNSFASFIDLFSRKDKN